MRLCYHCMHQIEKEKLHTCPKCGQPLTRQPIDEKYLQPGTVLQEKYVVGYPLGAGGFGNTYIGWNLMLFCKVAIKEFYPTQYCHRDSDRLTVTVSEEKQRNRFKKGLKQFLEEARNVAALQDIPGVVKISSFFEENGTGYIVMEYLEGMDVKTILSKSGDRKDYEWCRRVVLTVLHTLREVHKRGVLHRDIAPDNIFVTDEGIIKLIDFGAAKHVSALSDTKPDIMLKVGYAPIEQYSRNAPQGTYTDLYGVAALLYRMLTGQRPIPANERLEQDSLILPSEMGIEIPKQAEMGMMVCLNVQPQYRLQSADEFMEALDGRYFTPVYEPEWILPPLEEKPKIGEKLSRLPVIANVGLCIAGICLVGAVVFGAVRLGGRSADTGLENETVVMEDLSGKSVEEAEEYIDSLNGHHAGWNIQLQQQGTVFDLQAEDGTICEQSVEPSAILYNATEQKQSQVSENLKWEDDVLTGTIFYSVYSNSELCFGDIRGLNAYSLAKKLDIDPTDSSHFVEVEKDGAQYYDLVELETWNSVIKAEELEEEKNSQTPISYDKDSMVIFYAAFDYFYWESFPDFVGKNIMELSVYPLYRRVNETDRTLVGVGFIDESPELLKKCYTFSDKFKEGEIVRQTVAAGEECDTSYKLEDALLYVIDQKLTYTGKTGSQFMEMLSKWNFSAKLGNQDKAVLSQPVTSVILVDQNDEEVEYFTEDDELTVYLNMKEKPKH